MGAWPHGLDRRLEAEWMDQPGLKAECHELALRGLTRLNRWSCAARILWPHLAAFAKSRRQSSLRILDLASGAGDNAVALYQMGRRRGLELRIEGWDVSDRAVAYARRLAAAQGASVTFFRRDALGEPIPLGFDVIMSSLFLHHLDEARALLLLERMRQGMPGLLLVNDLRRCRGGLALAVAASRLLTRSAVVHNDAPASVRNAFTPEEVRGLARRAGLAGATVTPRWPFRLLLAWVRS